MTIRCLLFGCFVTDVPACDRCGADLCSPEFVQSARLEPLLHLASRLRKAGSLRIFRCEECARILPLRLIWHEWKRARRLGGGVTSTKFCSKRCEDDWFPF